MKKGLKCKKFQLRCYFVDIFKDFIGVKQVFLSVWQQLFNFIH